MSKGKTEREIAEFLGPSRKITDIYETTTEVDGVHAYSIGISVALPDGSEVTGAASGLLENRDQTLKRAQCELLERATIRCAVNSKGATFPILDSTGKPVGVRSWEEVWPQSKDPRWKYSTSNGVALSETREKATTLALRELFERDSLQRSWFSGMRPEKIQIQASLPIHGLSFYRLGDAALMAVRRSQAREGYDLGFSFFSGDELEAAQKKATDELLQRLSFDGGEEETESVPTEPGPDFHLWMTSQKPWVVLFERWLESGLPPDFELPRPDAERRVEFVDLTGFSPDPRFIVCKAVSPAVLPLCFGWMHPSLTSRGHVSTERKVHPCF